MLHERLPHAIGATEAEIAVPEARLGTALPDEFEVLYRATRARWEDRGDDYEAVERDCRVVGCECFSPMTRTLPMRRLVRALDGSGR
ncbi:hypothetical protein ACIQZB_33210 [Streptomyces sp. NPDC097727]|uniref:hypothetical protein n=1 Tax=Streptomyces sp. NPDC097727 TaxID=3366092 RepID=UPI00380CE458